MYQGSSTCKYHNQAGHHACQASFYWTECIVVLIVCHKSDKTNRIKQAVDNVRSRYHLHQASCLMSVSLHSLSQPSARTCYDPGWSHNSKLLALSGSLPQSPTHSLSVLLHHVHSAPLFSPGLLPIPKVFPQESFSSNTSSHCLFTPYLVIPHAQTAHIL